MDAVNTWRSLDGCQYFLEVAGWMLFTHGDHWIDAVKLPVLRRRLEGAFCQWK